MSVDELVAALSDAERHAIWWGHRRGVFFTTRGVERSTARSLVEKGIFELVEPSPSHPDEPRWAPTELGNHVAVALSEVDAAALALGRGKRQ